MESDNAQTLSRRARGLYQVTFSDHSMRELNKLPVEDQLALVDKISNVTPAQLSEPDDAIGRFFTGLVGSFRRYHIVYHIDEKEDIALDPYETEFSVKFY